MRNDFLSPQSFFSPVKNCDIFYSEYLSVVLVILVSVLYRKMELNFGIRKVGFVLLTAGGAANFLERTLTGCVRDYFDFFGLFKFNFFDFMVTLGAFLLIYGLWFQKTKAREN